MTSRQSETCVKLCSTYCCTVLPTPDFLLEFWENRRHSSMKSGQGQHALCLSWKWWNFHLVGLSAVSKQCKRDLREARSCSALQGGNPLVKGIISFSCKAPRLTAGKAWYMQGQVTAAQLPHGGCCIHCFVPVQAHLWQVEKEPLPRRMQGWSHSTCLCMEWQSSASASKPGWNTHTYLQRDEAKWNFFTIVLQSFV